MDVLFLLFLALGALALLFLLSGLCFYAVRSIWIALLEDDSFKGD